MKKILTCSIKKKTPYFILFKKRFYRILKMRKWRYADEVTGIRSWSILAELNLAPFTICHSSLNLDVLKSFIKAMFVLLGQHSRGSVHIF